MDIKNSTSDENLARPHSTLVAFLNKDASETPSTHVGALRLTCRTQGARSSSSRTVRINQPLFCMNSGDMKNAREHPFTTSVRTAAPRCGAEARATMKRVSVSGLVILTQAKSASCANGRHARQTSEDESRVTASALREVMVSAHISGGSAGKDAHDMAMDIREKGPQMRTEEPLNGGERRRHSCQGEAI
jgi:hypothetical protein